VYWLLGISAISHYCYLLSEYDGELYEDEYDYVVVARGFDALWFRHLLDPYTHTRIEEVMHSMLYNA
jgi:hypothetical protein